MEVIQMKKIIFVLIITVFCLNAFAADLTIEQEARVFIDNQFTQTVNKAVDLSNPGLMDKESTLNALIGYEVVKQDLSQAALWRYSAIIIKYGIEEKQVKYSPGNGSYYYNVTAPDILTVTSERALRMKADKILGELMRNESGNFVCANTEETYIEERDKAPKLNTLDFVYISKKNGRFIADNTAYVRITFAGNAEVCDLEIVNPELTPVKINNLVKLSATGARLEEYAVNKSTVQSTDGRTIGVDLITAKYARPTYYAVEVGDSVRLSPYYSFWSTYDLEDGASFDAFIHFALDAAQVQNLEDGMLDKQR
jgi:hypothetical protein